MNNQIFILDNSLLGNIFSDGPKTGIEILNHLHQKYNTFIVTDVVLLESQAPHLKDTFKKWIDSKGIDKTVTPTGLEVLKSGNIADAGEKSILYIVEGRAGNIPAGSKITIGTDDLSFFKDGAGKQYLSNTVQVQDVANEAVANGMLSDASYKSLRDNPRVANSNSRSNVTRWYADNEIQKPQAAKIATTAEGATLDKNPGLAAAAPDSSLNGQPDDVPHTSKVANLAEVNGNKPHLSKLGLAGGTAGVASGINRMANGENQAEKIIGCIEIAGSGASTALEAAGKLKGAGLAGIVISGVDGGYEVYKAGEKAEASGQNKTLAMVDKTAEVVLKVDANLLTLGMAGNATDVLAGRLRENVAEAKSFYGKAYDMAAGNREINLGELGSDYAEARVKDINALGEALNQTTPAIGYRAGKEVYTAREDLYLAAKDYVRGQLGFDEKKPSIDEIAINENALAEAAKITRQLAEKGCSVQSGDAPTTQHIYNGRAEERALSGKSC